MINIKKPNVQLAKNVTRSQPKTVTISNVNIKPVKKVSDVSVNTLQHINDTEILKDAYNPGIISTASKRQNTGGYVIDITETNINRLNELRSRLKGFKVPMVDNAVTGWNQIKSDIFLANRMKR